MTDHETAAQVGLRVHEAIERACREALREAEQGLERARATLPEDKYIGIGISVDVGLLKELLREYLKHHDPAVMRCSVCHSTSVELAFWVNPNTLQVGDALHETYQDDLDAGSCFCHSCERNTLLESIPEVL